MTIGQKIRLLRKQTGQSQEELSFALNVSRQTISKWEADAMLPTTDNIKVLCEHFKIKADFFFDEDNTDVSKNNSAVASETSAATVSVLTISKRNAVLFAFFITLSALLFLLCVIIGSISVFIGTQEPLGFDEVQVVQIDWVAIVCFVIAFCALASLITLIVLLSIQKKRKM